MFVQNVSRLVCFVFGVFFVTFQIPREEEEAAKQPQTNNNQQQQATQIVVVDGDDESQQQSNDSLLNSGLDFGPVAIAVSPTTTQTTQQTTPNANDDVVVGDGDGQLGILSGMRLKGKNS